MTRTLFARLKRLPVGAMRHRVAIEAPVDIADGAGGLTRSYETIDTVWAAIETLEADAALTDNRAGARFSYRITMRWRADIDNSRRLRFEDRVFVIRAVSDADGKRRRLSVLADEDAP
ncbi:phage head closure protein [Terrarubrum flagellatum]|uniref:phage head closure protein n=1 Tax=Terrirubrum flagellatum TaxID=2895980 RepID=UPI003144E55E